MEIWLNCVTFGHKNRLKYKNSMDEKYTHMQTAINTKVAVKKPMELNENV